VAVVGPHGVLGRRHVLGDLVGIAQLLQRRFVGVVSGIVPPAVVWRLHRVEELGVPRERHGGKFAAGADGQRGAILVVGATVDGGGVVEQSVDGDFALLVRVFSAFTDALPCEKRAQAGDAGTVVPELEDDIVVGEDTGAAAGGQLVCFGELVGGVSQSEGRTNLL